MGGRKSRDNGNGAEDDDDLESKKPYGWVLVLRGLAAAAIQLDDRPAALRVLIVAAEYMNQDGVCKISQDTIAARLGTKRQTVNEHLAVLDRMEILCGGASKDGILKHYVLNTEGLENKRFGQDRVDERRAVKRAAKKGKFDPEVVAAKSKPAPKPKPKPKQDDPEPAPKQTRTAWIMAGDEVIHPVFGIGTVQFDADGDEAYVRFISCERAVPTNILEPCPQLGPPLDAASITAHLIGSAVCHNRFGKGVVTGVQDNGVLTVMFSAGNERKMSPGYVRPVLDTVRVRVQPNEVAPVPRIHIRQAECRF